MQKKFLGKNVVFGGKHSGLLYYGLSLHLQSLTDHWGVLLLLTVSPGGILIALCAYVRGNAMKGRFVEGPLPGVNSAPLLYVEFSGK